MNSSRSKDRFPYEQAAGMLKIIAHPVRLSIITLLEGGRRSVREVQAAVGAKQSATSQHLNAMAARGILGREREGNVVRYFIEKKEVLKILSCIKRCCGKEG